MSNENNNVKRNLPVTKNTSELGKEFLYVCQNPHCQNVEKELALHSRNHKYCSNCGFVSIKSQLVSTFNWVVSVTEAE